MKIVDLANAVVTGAKLQEIGMRPGEKLHEEMISADDSRRKIILENRYVVTPVVAEWAMNHQKVQESQKVRHIDLTQMISG
jgi:UDP-N-acetylglucosamine 4,6-dehydratase